MHLIDNKTIAQALNRIAPTKVAVAYIGADWRTYIDPKKIIDLIVSPTLGSNPQAIRDAVNIIGWDHVHFLNELHAKVYIGDRQFAVGSFNLTSNGLSVRGLLEYGVVIESKNLHMHACKQFEELRAQACERYRTVEEKERQLAELMVIFNRSHAYGLIRNSTPVCKLAEYNPISSKDFYVCWYRRIPVGFDYEIIRKDIPNLIEDDIDTVSENWATFLPGDKIENDRWILLWETRNNGKPNKTKRLSWLYIDHVIPGGVKDDLYSTLVLQRKRRGIDTEHQLPPEPFDLKPPLVQDALREILARPEFSEFRPSEEKSADERWSVVPTMGKFQQFVNAVKDRAKELAGKNNKSGLSGSAKNPKRK